MARAPTMISFAKVSAVEEFESESFNVVEGTYSPAIAEWTISSEFNPFIVISTRTTLSNKTRITITYTFALSAYTDLVGKTSTIVFKLKD